MRSIDRERVDKNYRFIAAHLTVALERIEQGRADVGGKVLRDVLAALPKPSVHQLGLAKVSAFEQRKPRSNGLAGPLGVIKTQEKL